jgi:hypothetical protein
VTPRRGDEVEFITKEAQAHRVWKCRWNNAGCARTEPCRSCLSARNRRKGMRKQRAARKALRIPVSRFASQMGNEELWLGSVRVEVKAGKQVEAPWRRFLAGEAQSEGSRAVGDARNFLAVWMPENSTDGLFVGRLSRIAEIIEALHEQLEDG